MKKHFLSPRRKDRKDFFLAFFAASPAWTPGEGREQDAEALREPLL